MNSQTDAVPESAPGLREIRPLYWSVRRELWENRSIYLAPLAAAAVVVFGFLISTVGMPERRRALLSLDPGQQRAMIQMPYNFAAGMLVVTAFLVGVFYCLDALHGDRRDRSILFWKSLPVSDLTTVLSKASIPLVVLPLLIFSVAVATQLIILLLSSAILLPSGLAATTWARLPLFQLWLALLYALVAIALWHAPLYGWLLLVSGWARRAAFLWAVLPWLAVCALEAMAFRTSHFASFLKDRLAGWYTQAFVIPAHGTVPANPLTQLTPSKFLSTPGLWIGLVVAAIFLALAVRMRRDRGPI